MFVVCAAVAIGVEFAQLFFPPRTVSLNDILAEFIGTGLGIVVWLVWGGALQRFAAGMERGGLPAIRAAVVGYVLAYLALSLFPYDFLVSAQEFAEKFAAGGYGFLVASETCGRLSTCAGKLVAEIVAVVPLGVLLGMALGRDARNAYVIAALSGPRARLRDRDRATVHRVRDLRRRLAADPRRRCHARRRAVPARAPAKPRRAAAVHRARALRRRSRSISSR